MTKIKINNRHYTVRSYTIGQCFATGASVRVGSREFARDPRPYGHERSAISGVVAAVQERYPDAEVITV